MLCADRYERVNVDREAEWRWLRLEAMLDFEADTSVPGLDEYYTQLVELNNKRSVDRVEARVGRDASSSSSTFDASRSEGRRK